ncbi:MAG: hypothetical protein RI556_10940 [Hydrogenovibrio sp.]|uniref:hypothetical protein n=1 Tax=Hydrogenovibrio sp. TaxID=2065821 RepID=UPI00286FD0CD|nr:hypothetical protein [Hydrogenovibrio sp.]MDR9499681.1 hypothetical protein [Hydrogenovibrio sp.]
MLTLKKSLFVSFLVMTGLALSACRGAQVQNMESQPVPAQVSSAEEVKGAIKRAGVGLGWIMTEQGEDTLQGTLNLRSHQAVVNIPYSAKEYSIVYHSSVELDYDPEKKTIHSNYNGWIQNLNNRIQVQLNGL